MSLLTEKRQDISPPIAGDLSLSARTHDGDVPSFYAIRETFGDSDSVLSYDPRVVPGAGDLRSMGGFVPAAARASLDLWDLPPVSGPRPATLTPQSLNLSLGFAGSKVVNYDLDLPPRPAPLDVYFLVDSTQSMFGPILALQDALPKVVTDLRRHGFDVWAGLGEVRSYPREDRSAQVNFAYRQDRDLGPVDQELLDAFYALESNGNSGANLTGLIRRPPARART